MAPASEQTEEKVLLALTKGPKSVSELFYEVWLVPQTIRKAAWQLRDKGLIRYYKKLRGAKKYLELTSLGRKKVKEIKSK